MLALERLLGSGNIDLQAEDLDNPFPGRLIEKISFDCCVFYTKEGCTLFSCICILHIRSLIAFFKNCHLPDFTLFCFRQMEAFQKGVEIHFIGAIDTVGKKRVSF